MALLTKPPVSVSQDEHLRIGFIAAWMLCLIFYFAQYALRSAPGVMLPELAQAHGLGRVELGSLIGLYYYTYALFAIVAGAALDRLGAKYVIPVGVLALAAGAALFGSGELAGARIGRLLQGAGSAVAFTGAVYLAARGFPREWLATAVGVTQCLGMLGGSVGQFGVAPLVHSVLDWRSFWLISATFLVGVALSMMMITPGARDARAPAGPWRNLFAPYRTVLANPQSWLCGVVAGLLFLPTTIFDMIWGVPFLREGLHVDFAHAALRASMVPMGWVIGCPLLGYAADYLGRRKPVVVAGVAVMLATGAAILYLPDGAVPPYLLGLLFGVGSSAAMIPYSVIKEVNPDEVKGSATGAINFLVFAMTALVNPLFGRYLQSRDPGGALTLADFRSAGSWLLAGVALAGVLTFFLRETGHAAQGGTTR
ncbi:MFS transporter [Methylocella sp.]|uniref:MFS transporter n=1 Tax=Methylocella sp. TaxID=1978226 RepID=UPI003784B217